ncbi:hypothetical protein CLFE_014970 [Clostridium felsineum DSM 794]|nr:hypothetical protein CLFE_014970 [Clostridium felsineum DSM 794]
MNYVILNLKRYPVVKNDKEHASDLGDLII